MLTVHLRPSHPQIGHPLHQRKSQVGFAYLISPPLFNTPTNNFHLVFDNILEIHCTAMMVVVGGDYGELRFYHARNGLL